MRAPRAEAGAVLGAIAIAALGLALYAARHYAGIAGSDDFEYASIARNVLRGRGVTTQHLYPADLARWGSVPHPEIAHPPGLPLLIAASFRLFGVSDWAAVAPIAAAWVACVGAAAWLARRLFGATAGWIAAVLLAGHPVALGLAVVALAVPAALVLTLSAGFLLVGRGRAAALLGGIAFGVGQALRENMLLAVPGMLVLTAHKRWFLGGCLLAVAGLVARNLGVAGQPWVSLVPLSVQGFTGVYPAQDVLRHLDPMSLPEFLRVHPAAFIAKWLRNVAVSPALLLMAVGAPLGAALFLPALVLVRRRIALPPAFRALALALGWMLGLTIAGTAAFAVFPRYFVVWVPLLAVVAGGVASAAWASRAQSRLAGPAVMLPLALAVAFYGWALRAPVTGKSYAKAQHFLAEAVPANALVASDFPEIALWRADRSAAWLPVTRAEFYAMRRRIEIPFVLLTSKRTPLWDPSWRAVWTRADSLPGYMESACMLDDELEVRLFKATGPNGSVERP